MSPNPLPPAPGRIRRSLVAAGVVLLSAGASPSAAAAEPCAGPGTAEAVASHLAASQAAHQAKNADSYLKEWKTGRQAALCTDQPLPAHTIWLFHLLEGISATAGADPAHAIASYEAAQRVDPAFEFSDTWVFPEHVIRNQYEAARSRPLAEEQPVWVPRKGTLTLNGVAATKRSPDLPALWQYTSPGGSIATGYVQEGQDPVWEAPWGEGAHQRQGWKRRLTVGAVSTGALAAASGAASFYFRGQVQTLGEQVRGGETGLEGQIQANGRNMAITGVTGAGLAGAALTLGVSAVVVDLRW